MLNVVIRMTGVINILNQKVDIKMLFRRPLSPLFSFFSFS